MNHVSDKDHVNNEHGHVKNAGRILKKETSGKIKQNSRKEVRNLAGAFESGEIHISSDQGNDRAGYPEGYSPGRGKGAQYQ